MNIRKGTKKVLIILLLLTNISNSYGYSGRPDITADIRQPTNSKSWERMECCYPGALYKAAKNIIADKIYENQKIIKIQDMLHQYWRKHTHKKH